MQLRGRGAACSQSVCLWRAGMRRRAASGVALAAAPPAAFSACGLAAGAVRVVRASQELGSGGRWSGLGLAVGHAEAV